MTQATKEIEAKISNEAWDRQKQWEMKREALFAAVKKMAEIDEGLVGLDASVQVEQKPEDPGWLELVAERRSQWKKASVGFDEAKLLVTMVCRKETILAVERFGLISNQIAGELIKNRNQKIFGESAKELATRLFAAREAIRRELGIEGGT